MKHLAQSKLHLFEILGISTMKRLGWRFLHRGSSFSTEPIRRDAWGTHPKSRRPLISQLRGTISAWRIRAASYSTIHPNSEAPCVIPVWGAGEYQIFLYAGKPHNTCFRDGRTNLWEVFKVWKWHQLHPTDLQSSHLCCHLICYPYHSSLVISHHLYSTRGTLLLPVSQLSQPNTTFFSCFTHNSRLPGVTLISPTGCHMQAVILSLLYQVLWV